MNDNFNYEIERISKIEKSINLDIQKRNLNEKENKPTTLVTI